MSGRATQPWSIANCFRVFAASDRRSALRSFFVGLWQRSRHACSGHATFGILFLIVLTSLPAYAGDAIHFHVARQRADRALVEFAKQAGASVLFPYDEVSQRTANSLEGEFTVNEGLARLLSGTGLIGTVDSSGAQLTVQLDESPKRAADTPARRGFLAALRGMFSSQRGRQPQANSSQPAQINGTEDPSSLMPVMI